MRDRGFWLAQAVRGPIILITVGCLFALQQAHVLSFGRTWPLILIVLGVLKLVERTLAPAPPFVPPAAPFAQPPYPGGYPPAGPFPRPVVRPTQPPPPPAPQGPSV